MGLFGGKKCDVCGQKIKTQAGTTVAAGPSLSITVAGTRDFTGPTSEFAGTCPECGAEVHFRCAKVERHDELGPEYSYKLVKCPRCGGTIQRID